MRVRIALLTLVLVSGVALAGCAGTQGESPTTATTTETTTTTDTPEKGDNLLSVSKVNESTAMKVNESKREPFSSLNESQQDVFLKAYNCSCNVEQGVFKFNDKDRIEYVKYEGQWYYLRVSMV